MLSLLLCFKSMEVVFGKDCRELVSLPCTNLCRLMTTSTLKRSIAGMICPCVDAMFTCDLLPPQLGMPDQAAAAHGSGWWNCSSAKARISRVADREDVEQEITGVQPPHRHECSCLCAS